MAKTKLHRLGWLALPILLSGCGGSTSSGTIKIRAMDASAGESSVNISAGANIIMSGGTYGNVTGYQTIAQTGSQLFLLTGSTGATLSDPTFDLQANSFYTAYATGPSTSPGLLLVSEDHSNPGAKVRINLVNLSAAVGNVDVYVTAPGASLATSTPITTGLAFQSPFTTLVAPGSYEVRFTNAGAQTVVGDQTVGALTAGAIVRYVLIDSSSGAAPQSITSLTDSG